MRLLIQFRNPFCKFSLGLTKTPKKSKHTTAQQTMIFCRILNWKKETGVETQVTFYRAHFTPKCIYIHTTSYIYSTKVGEGKLPVGKVFRHKAPIPGESKWSVATASEKLLVLILVVRIFTANQSPPEPPGIAAGKGAQGTHKGSSSKGKRSDTIM